MSEYRVGIIAEGPTDIPIIYVRKRGQVVGLIHQNGKKLQKKQQRQKSISC